MNKADITQSIIDYLQNEKAEYAVMLYGSWGSGKTYLYKHEIVEAIKKTEYGKNKHKEEVYISLYGVSSIEDIAKEIVVNYIVKSKLNKNQTLVKLFNRINKMIGIASKMVSFSIDNFSFDLPDISETFGENTDFSDMVICFDDLERCSIPILEVFGMINHLIEHCGCKVILIADEKNIGKIYANTDIENKYLSILNGRRVEVSGGKNGTKAGQDKNSIFEEISIQELKELNEHLYGENYLYKDIKEKVIGISLKYDLDLNEEYETIIEDTISGLKLKKILKSNKEMVLHYMSKCDNQNIRIMKNWLINFDRIYKMLTKCYDDEKKYMDEVIKRFLIYSIRVACAVGKNKPLFEWKPEQKIFESITLEDEFLTNIEGYKFIDILFQTYTLQKEEVCHAASHIIRRMKEEEARAQKYSRGEYLEKLCLWKYMEDDEIAESAEYLSQEVKEQKYSYQNYSTIIYLLVYLQSIKLYKGKIDNIKKYMICNIENEEDEINIEDVGLDLSSEELKEEFYKYYHPIQELIDKTNHVKSKEKMRKVITDEGENWAEVFKKCCHENSEMFLEKNQFLSMMDSDKIFNKLKTAKTKEIYDIISGIKFVYRFGNINEFYAGDIHQIEKWIEKLDDL